MFSGFKFTLIYKRRYESGSIKMTRTLFLKVCAWENTVYIMTTTLFNTHTRKNTIHAFKQTVLTQPLKHLSPSAWGRVRIRSQRLHLAGEWTAASASSTVKQGKRQWERRLLWESTYVPCQAHVSYSINTRVYMKTYIQRDDRRWAFHPLPSTKPSNVKGRSKCPSSCTV